MFTGLIQGTGIITSLSPQGKESRLTIQPSFSMPDIIDGESIAVNGTCLSVEEHTGSATFSLYASAETMRRTTLRNQSVGSIVNLERALAVGERLGGHIVAGHVDCLAKVVSMEAAGDSIVCRLSFPAEFGGEVVPKGSVTLDGISLTINECGSDFLTVNIIPDTQKRTTMRQWKAGVEVNMETDIIGKYVRHLLAPSLGSDKKPNAGTSAPSSTITRAYLLENGFF